MLKLLIGGSPCGDVFDVRREGLEGDEVNALKSLEKRSRRERDKAELQSQAVLDTTSFFMKCVAVSLHEIYGFGEKRCERVISDISKNLSEYFSRYGGECVEKRCGCAAEGLSD